jgi:hypothetical protein
MPGTLYLLRSHADASLHKIGITNNWQQRAKQLEVGLTTACVGRWTVNDNRQLERFLHRRFKPHRLPQSEWFHLSPEQVQWVISAAGKAADDLKQATSHQQASQPPRPPAHTTYRHPAPYRLIRPQPAKPAPAAAKPAPATQPESENSFGSWVALGAVSLVGWLMVAAVAGTSQSQPSSQAISSAPVVVPSAEELAIKAKQQAEQETQALKAEIEQEREAMRAELKRLQDSQQQAELEAQAQKREAEDAKVAANYHKEKAALSECLARYNRPAMLSSWEADRFCRTGRI